MALETALDFTRRLIGVAGQEKKIKTISLSVLDSVVVKARFKLNDKFIDVFYNSQTGTTAYNLIAGGKRIFGADETNQILIGKVVLLLLKISSRAPSKGKRWSEAMLVMRDYEGFLE